MVIHYTLDGKRYRISRHDLAATLASTSECLSPAFNMQVQMLIDLLDTVGGEVDLERLHPEQIAPLEASYPGITLESLKCAVKAYHMYAANMYYI